MYGRVGVSMKDSLVMKSPKSSGTGSKYTEDWIPIKDITDGCIITNNGTKVTGVKIRPRNIFILDKISQDNTIIALKNFYNMIDFEFWLISADKPVDISDYLARMQVLFNQTTSPVVRKMIMQDVDKANEFIENSVTDTEYYILFREKNNEQIQKKLRTLITGLANAGLESTQTSNEDLRVILDNFLNGGVNTEFGTVMPI